MVCSKASLGGVNFPGRYRQWFCLRRVDFLDKVMFLVCESLSRAESLHGKKVHPTAHVFILHRCAPSTGGGPGEGIPACAKSVIAGFFLPPSRVARERVQQRNLSSSVRILVCFARMVPPLQYWERVPF